MVNRLINMINMQLTKWLVDRASCNATPS